MILDDIVASARVRVKAAKENKPPAVLRQEAECLQAAGRREYPPVSFRQTIGQGGLRVIAEIKKASPSKGLIAPDFDYLDIAKDYEAAGAAAVSVLTEPAFFQGSPRYLSEVKQNITLPVLRKDFIVEEYQVYEAYCMGADAFLLIAAVLSEAELRSWIALGERFGMDALVEVHDEAEMEKAAVAGAGIVGVNNRNLKTFQVDFETTFRLRDKAPKDALLVAESGVQTAADIQRLQAAGVNAVLIGETLMRAEDKRACLRALMGAQDK